MRLQTNLDNIFFSFFYSHYNPLWVLAFSVILFYSALSSLCFLHRLFPIICVSSSISTIQLFLGLPPILLPIGFHSNILLGVLLSTIRITWPSQAILLLFTNLTMSAFPIISLVHNSFWFSRIHIHSALFIYLLAFTDNIHRLISEESPRSILGCSSGVCRR